MPDFITRKEPEAIQKLLAQILQDQIALLEGNLHYITA